MAANPWEIVGSGLRQTAQDVGAFGERQRQYQEMVQRRVMAMQQQQQEEREAQIRQEQADRQKQQFEAEQARIQVEQQEKDRQAKAEAEFRKYAQGTPEKPAQPYMAPGMGPQGEAATQPVPAFQPNRQQLQDEALRTGAYQNEGVRAYFDDTKPQQPAGGMTFEERAELERLKAGLRTSSDQPIRWDRDEINGRRVQVHPMTGEQRDLGPVTPKVSPKASENIKNKLQALTLAKSQLAKMQTSYNALKGSYSAGPGGNRIPTEAGKSFDADVDGFRSTLRSLTRTPGEGSMSDYEGKLSQAALPNRGEWEGVTQRKIDNMADQISLLENGYLGMQKDYESPEAQAAHADPKAMKRAAWDAKNGPKEGDTKVNSNGRRIVFTAGGWRAAK